MARIGEHAGVDRCVLADPVEGPDPVVVRQIDGESRPLWALDEADVDTAPQAHADQHDCDRVRQPEMAAGARRSIHQPPDEEQRRHGFDRPERP